MTILKWIFLIFFLYFVFHNILTLYFLHFNLNKKLKDFSDSSKFQELFKSLETIIKSSCNQEKTEILAGKVNKKKLKNSNLYYSPNDPRYTNYLYKINSAFHYKQNKIFSKIIGIQDQIKSRFTVKKNQSLPFQYVINNNKICDKDLYLINFLLSSPNDFSKRNDIREMWGAAEWRKVTRYRLVMFLGQSLNESVNQRILIENELYGDIIQLDFIDSYENLTLKVLSGFHWISNFCSNAEWVLKSDSDVIVNIFSITKFLKNYDRVSKNSHDEILCKPKASHELLPFRHLGSNKWNVMYEEYPFDAYPPHCYGPAYFIPRALVRKLYHVASKHNPFRIEDAYYTGILPLLLDNQINIKNLNPFISWRPSNWPKLDKVLLILELEKSHGKGSSKIGWEEIVSKHNYSTTF